MELDAMLGVGADRRDERGSLIVMMTVIMVMVLLSAAVLSQVVGNQRNVIGKFQSASAVAGADAGLSDALFRMDQLSSPSSGSAFCMDSTGLGTEGSSQCTKAPSTGPLAGVSYVASPTDGTGQTWKLQSKATTKGISAAVQEYLQYSAGFPFALFGNSGLDFHGNNSQGLGTYNPGSASSTNPDTSGSVAIGSNGPIKCAGGLPTNVTITYYTGGGSPQGCTNNPTVADTSKYSLASPTAPAGAVSGCTGTPTTTESAGGQTVTAYELGSGYGVSSIGTAGQTTSYLCSDNPILISGNLTVNGTVKIYIMLDTTTDSNLLYAGLATLSIAGSSKVNTAFDGVSSVPTSGTLPNAEALQIFSNSDGSVGSSNGSGYTYGGVIDAPNAYLVGDGCKSAYYGALVLNTLTCNGGPHLQVFYDNDLKTYYGPPSITGYTQANPGDFTVP